MRLPPEEFKRLYDEVTLMINSQQVVNPKYVRTRRKTKEIAAIRQAIAREIKVKYDLSTTNIGYLLNVDHSTVVKYLQ